MTHDKQSYCDKLFDGRPELVVSSHQEHVEMSLQCRKCFGGKSELVCEFARK